MLRLLALCASLFSVIGLAAPAAAQVEVRLSFAYQDAGQTERDAPEPRLQVTNLLVAAPIEVRLAPVTDDGRNVVAFTLTEADFAGPYARLRLAVDGLRLPPDDAKSDTEMQFAFEMILRRDLLGATVDIEVPVVTSSRKGALKPFMEMPQIAEDLPQRFLMAQQWVSLYAASEQAVAASPGSFALHRLISRALVDFSLAMANGRPGAVLLIPAPEMRRVLELYWGADGEGAAQHLRAYADARTILWADLAGAETLLRQARRSGLEALKLCGQASELVSFFETHLPAEDEARKVDALFDNPGSLQAYLEGRRLDIRFACGRPQI